MELEFLQTLQGLHHPVLDRVLVIITTLGNAGWFFIALGLILLAFKKTRRTGFHVLLALVFSLIFCNLILKGLVARDRPSWLVPDVELLIANPKDFSFPSGHTSAAMAAATAIFMHDKRYGIAAFVLAACIAFSRMYLFVHFPTDVLGGAVTGVVSAVAAFFLMRWFENRKNENMQA